MAKNTISFLSQDDTLLANLAWLPITVGDTLSFEVPDGFPPVLTFSSDLAAILSPSPTGPVTLDAANPVVYTFTSAQPGNHAITVSITPDAVATVPQSSSSTLFFVCVPPSPAGAEAVEALSPSAVAAGHVDPPPAGGN